VLAITGISVDQWAASGKREPERVIKPGCGELMALLHRAPNPFVQKLEERVNLVAVAPWGVQLAAGFSREHALSNYAMLAKRYGDVLAGRDPSLLSSIFRTRGTQPFYQVRVGADTRAAAENLAARSAAPAAPASCCATARGSAAARRHCRRLGLHPRHLLGGLPPPLWGRVGEGGWCG